MLKKLKRAVKAVEAAEAATVAAILAADAAQDAFEIADCAYAESEYWGEVKDLMQSATTADLRAEFEAAKDRNDAAGEALWTAKCAAMAANTKVCKILQKMLAQYS